MTLHRNTIGQLRHALEVQREESRSQAESWLDVTADLEETLDRFIQLFHEAPIGYLTFDDKGTIIELNAEAAKLLNAETTRARGKPFLAFVFRPDVKLFLTHVLKCGHGMATTELRLGRGSRGPRDVRLISRRTQSPQARHPKMFTIMIEITAERREEEALRASEKRHREIVEAANEGICITNAQEQITFANRRLGAMLGVPSPALVGCALSEVVLADETPAPPLALDGRRIEPRSAEQRLLRHDGTLLRASVSESLLHDEKGRFTGTLRMYTDTTARHELAEAREMLVRQLVAAQEGERQRIARELHDQLSQHIVALSLGLARLPAAAAQGDSAALIAHLRSVSDALGRDMHTLALELRPSALDHLGLAEAVRGYAEDLSARTHLQIDVHCDGVDELPLDASVQTGVYRVVQEALTNVVKHADARVVSVILKRRAEALQLIVEDDGRGFDLSDRRCAAPAKLGLTGMRERAGLLGGVVTIESSPKTGTTVYARIPLNAPLRNENGQETSAVTR